MNQFLKNSIATGALVGALLAPGLGALAAEITGTLSTDAGQTMVQGQQQPTPQFPDTSGAMVSSDVELAIKVTLGALLVTALAILAWISLNPPRRRRDRVYEA